MSRGQHLALVVLLGVLAGAAGIAATVYLDNPWQGICLIALLGAVYLVNDRLTRRTSPVRGRSVGPWPRRSSTIASSLAPSPRQ